MKRCLAFLFVLFLQVALIELGFCQVDIYDSGGPLMPEQASYDVTFYDLTLEMLPRDSTIQGTVGVQAMLAQPLDWFVMDLDTLLAVHRVHEMGSMGPVALAYHRVGGKLWIDLNGARQPGSSVHLEVDYGGRPRLAPNPPWQSGFTWTHTSRGEHWLASTSWGDGSDVWWPSKDHVSDGPDSMAMHITVPDPLSVATNGVLKSVEPRDNGTTTYHWFISSPIDIQNVALTAAPFRLIEDSYTGVAGDRFPVKLWVLPENYEDGLKLFPEILEHLRFFEELFGPYPFRAEKYGVVQTPYLGMEHQTIIAYGNGFPHDRETGKNWGFDTLHHHELSHEWWGNLVTNLDWRDMWLHEGFGSYMQPLYSEHIRGREAYQEHMASQRSFWNIYPVAPRSAQTTHGIYKSPIYPKGSWVLHTLRYLVGDDVFFRILRRMAYPNPEMAKITDGSQTRYVTTDDFLYVAELVSGLDLDWFFEVYLRQASLPVLLETREGDELTLRWQAPENLDFPMPIDVKLNKEIRRFEIPEAGLTLKIRGNREPEIDPNHRVLYRKAYPPVVSLDLATLEALPGRYELEQNGSIASIDILREGGQILATRGMSQVGVRDLSREIMPKLEIFPQSTRRFFFREAEHVFIEFRRDARGRVIGLTYQEGDRSLPYVKR